MSLYKKCLLCPRLCGADREAGICGHCGETGELRLAFAGIHRGEEPPVTGTGGSGTIFVTGCNLGCAFCQNFQISRGMGRSVDTGEFANICLVLQEKGAENINIVTGSHAAPAITAGIAQARKQGLNIPVLWNSSGYEGMQTLENLRDFVDVYLPDLKTMDNKIAAKFFNAPDYPEKAVFAIKKMMEYRKLRFENGIMVSGVMIRHLVLPGYLESTRQVLSWFSKYCRGSALLSLMTQYTPVQSPDCIREIPARYVSGEEYGEILSMLEEFGIDEGYCQELVTGSEWLPDFTRPNPFSSDLSLPVWHWL